MQNYYLHSTADPLDDTRNMRSRRKMSAQRAKAKQSRASLNEAEKAAVLICALLLMLVMTYTALVVY